MSKVVDRLREVMGSAIGGTAVLSDLKKIAQVSEMRVLAAEVRERTPRNVALDGFKVCSQNDEDGVIAAIFAAVGGNRTFFEIGVEDGTECNTHYLALQGWRGAWVEANDVSAAAIRTSLGGGDFPGRLKLIENFATVDNIVELYQETCGFCGCKDIDFFSLDIDSNDLFVLRELLGSGASPTVIAVEYNGKFPPPLSISVDRDDKRGWATDDYFGASLQSFYDLLSSHGYALVGCTLAGINAFFVKTEKLNGLESYTPEQVWQPMRLYLASLPGGHVATLKFLRDALRR